MNEDLLKLVENKRIAIVGPAPYLTNLGQGKMLDEYDVVIRPNQFFVSDSLKKDYGLRTDIMVHNFGTPWMPGLKEQISRNPDDFSELKMCICTATKSEHSEVNFLSWPDDYISNVVRNFHEINKHDVPFYWIGVKKYREFYNEIGCEPYTGILSIMSLLEYPIKELYVTGFNFYRGNNVYHEGYLSPLDSSQETENSGGSHGDNCNQKQIMFMKNVYQSNKTLIVDEQLKELILDS